jgi:hypothetical protein
MSDLSAPDHSVTGSDSAEVADPVGTDFKAAKAEQEMIVFDSETPKITDPEYQDVVDLVAADPATAHGRVTGHRLCGTHGACPRAAKGRGGPPSARHETPERRHDPGQDDVRAAAAAIGLERGRGGQTGGYRRDRRSPA